jgi:putative nucleotidyltransferase with HDIG domain
MIKEDMAMNYLPYMDLMVKRGLLLDEDLERLKEIYGKSRKDPEAIIVEEGMLSKERLLKTKAEFYDCASVDVKNVKVDTLSVRMIPKSMCDRYKVLCLQLNGRILEGVMMDPGDKFARDYIKMRTGYEFAPMVGYWADMKDVIEMAFSLPEIHKHKPKETSEVRPMPTPRSEALREAPREVPREVPRESPREDSAEAPAEAPADWKRKERKLEEALRSVKNEWEIQTLIGDISKDLGTFLDKRTLIPRILELALKIFNVEGVSLILLKKGQPFLFFKNVMGSNVDKIQDMVIPLDEKSVAGWIALNKKPVLINDVNQDERHSKKVDEASNFVTRSLLGVPVKYGDEVLGVLEAVNRREGQFTDKDTGYLAILASHAAIALKNAEIYEKLQNFSMEAVELLIDFLEYIDSRFKDHMVEVARIASSMGKAMKLSETEHQNLTYASFLHDIGKIKAKKGEYEKHPVYGAEILEHIKLFEGLLPYVLYHHERFDGSGFPYKLAGDKIPLGAQILAVAEAYVEGRLEAKGTSREAFFDSFMEAFDGRFNPALREPFRKVAISLEQKMK